MKTIVVFLFAFGVMLPSIGAFGDVLPPPPRPPAPAADYGEKLPDPAQEERARALQRELRCPLCQGQSLDESDAPIAADLRQIVREQIVAGKSDTEIKQFMVDRYGDFILMRPPVKPSTYALWFAPGLVFLVGAGIVGLTIMHARRRAAQEPESAQL